MSPPPGTARTNRSANRATAAWIAVIVAITTLVGEIRRGIADWFQYSKPTPNNVDKSR